MRVLMVTASVVFLLASAAVAKETPCLVGAGAVVTTRPYAGTDSRVMPIPFFSWEYKKFTLQGIEAGYKFYDKDGLVLAALGQPHFMGYHSSDSDALAGMEDRRESFDLGLKAEYHLPFAKGWSVEGKVVNDALSRYNGREATAELKKSVMLDRVRFVFSGGIKVQSSQLTDYYYGVTSAEARADRPAYTPGCAVNPTAALTLMTGLSKEWPIVLRLGAERLDKNISKSPIVKDDYILTAFAGLARKF